MKRILMTLAAILLLFTNAAAAAQRTADEQVGGVAPGDCGQHGEFWQQTDYGSLRLSCFPEPNESGLCEEGRRLEYIQSIDGNQVACINSLEEIEQCPAGDFDGDGVCDPVPEQISGPVLDPDEAEPAVKSSPIVGGVAIIKTGDGMPADCRSAPDLHSMPHTKIGYGEWVDWIVDDQQGDGWQRVVWGDFDCYVQSSQLDYDFASNSSNEEEFETEGTTELAESSDQPALTSEDVISLPNTGVAAEQGWSEGKKTAFWVVIVASGAALWGGLSTRERLH